MEDGEVVERELLAQADVDAADVGGDRVANLFLEHRLQRVAGAGLARLVLIGAGERDLDAVLRGALDLGRRTRVLRPAHLRGTQEARDSGFVHLEARSMDVVPGVPGQRHVDQVLGREPRLLAFVETDFAAGAVQVAGAYAAVLPEPVLQEGAQGMR